VVRLDDRERQLDPRVVRIWRLSTVLSWVPPLIIGAGIAFVVLGRNGAWVLLAGLLASGASVLWYPPARYRRWRWQLTPLAIELRYGVLVRRHEAVPYFRVQQIDVTQGPLDRLLGLATLQVTTASASGSAALPGIVASEAPAIRADLLARAAEAVAQHPSEISDAV
jgi:uncharacterized protein